MGQYRRVTDGQTDGRTDGHVAIAITRATRLGLGLYAQVLATDIAVMIKCMWLILQNLIAFLPYAYVIFPITYLLTVR